MIFILKQRKTISNSFLGLRVNKAMLKRNNNDCVGLRCRMNNLHQTWKWLHQTIELHEYLISMTSPDTQFTKYHSH